MTSMIDTGRVTLVDPEPTPVSAIKRMLHDGNGYELTLHISDDAERERCVVMQLLDDSDVHTIVAFDPAQAETLRGDIASVLAGGR